MTDILTNKGPSEYLIGRCVMMLGSGALAEDVKRVLDSQDLTEYDKYLAYCGALTILRMQERTAPRHDFPKI